MEQEEKKKREDYSQRRQSKSTSSFPIDLTAEILSWLPEKSVARFSCVSKLWLSITTNPYFMDLFETRSPRPRLLLCVRKDNNLFVSSIPQNPYSQPIHRHHMKLSREHTDHYPYRMESVNGLVCFSESPKPFVWNPRTGQLLTLHRPYTSSKHMNALFGYDPVEGKHKVVCLPYNKTCNVCQVFTLGSRQESWRNVRVNHMHSCVPCGYTRGRCINGVIYYLAYNRPGCELILMSFDVRSERFQMIQVPSGIASDLLIIYKGRLACADRINDTRLWILEDAKKHKWSSQDFLSLLGRRYLSFGTRFRLKGFTSASEFIYVPDKFHNSFYILFYDPVRNSCRRFQLEGNYDDQYGSNKNGECVVSFDACPNHIASQMSL